MPFDDEVDFVAPIAFPEMHGLRETRIRIGANAEDHQRFKEPSHERSIVLTRPEVHGGSHSFGVIVHQTQGESRVG